MRKILIGAVLALCFLMISLTLVGKPLPRADRRRRQRAKEPRTMNPLALAAAVTVARVAPADFTETVLATGSLVPREEILVGPEVEGLRVTEVLADEGMRVKKGDVLARLVADTLDAQLAQNDAGAGPRHGRHRPGQERHRAGRGARSIESSNAFERAKPLQAAGHMAESAYDQREQAARTARGAARRRPRRPQGGRGREGADRGPAPRARLAARPHRGGGAGRRHHQPPHGARRRLRRGRRRADVPHRRQGRGRARRRGHRDAHGRRQGRPARARRGRRPRRRSPAPCASSRPRSTRRRGSAACASSSATTRACGSAPSPAAASRPASGRGLAVPASAVLYGPDGPIRAGGARPTASRRAGSRPGSPAGALVEVREGLSEGDSSWPAPAPSCATATPCARRATGQAERPS